MFLIPTEFPQLSAISHDATRPTRPLSEVQLPLSEFPFQNCFVGCLLSLLVWSCFYSPALPLLVLGLCVRKCSLSLKCFLIMRKGDLSRNRSVIGMAGTQRPAWHHLRFVFCTFPTMYMSLVSVLLVVVQCWFSSLVFLRLFLDMFCSHFFCWSVNLYSLHHNLLK